MALAEVLVRAVRRGVRIVVETHSSLFLLSVQSLIAKQRIDYRLVKLHWFDRTRYGVTKVASGDMDESGAFGEWPEDFGSVNLEAERQYLDAVSSQRVGGI